MSISAWKYAERIANLRGIRSVAADHDAFEAQHVAQMSGIVDVLNDDSPEGRRITELVHADRERKARNTLKDWALAHLPTDANALPPERKQKLVLLFGGGHNQGMRRAFDDMGLHATFNIMQYTDDPEGRLEQNLAQVGRRAMSVTSQTVGRIGNRNIIGTFRPTSGGYNVTSLGRVVELGETADRNTRFNRLGRVASRQVIEQPQEGTTNKHEK